jgi:hypothetical protein
VGKPQGGMGGKSGCELGHGRGPRKRKVGKMAREGQPEWAGFGGAD